MQTLPEPGERVTLADVARKAGVSIAAASRALNGRSEVSEGTRSVVMKAAEQLGYVPNAAARALVTGTSKTLGLLVNSGLAGYGPIIEGVEDQATSLGYGTLFCNSADSQERALGNLEVLRSNATAGVLLTPVQSDTRDVEYLERYRMPYVLIGRHFPERDAPYVIVDNVRCGRLITEHFVETGHNRIAHIAGPRGVSTATDRLKGYQLALVEAGHLVDQTLVRFAPYTLAGGYDAAKELLSDSDRPTAIFAAIDLQAIGAMRAATDLGLRVPQDVAIAGGDDTELAAALMVPLTCTRTQLWDQGVQAVTMLVDLIEGREPNTRHVVLKPELVVRDSTVV